MTQRPGRRPVRRAHRREDRLGLLIFCVALIALLVIISPLDVTQKALNVDPTAPTSGSTGLRITELMADNSSAFPDENGNFSDWLELTNVSDSPINLKDRALSTGPTARALSSRISRWRLVSASLSIATTPTKTSRASPCTPSLKFPASRPASTCLTPTAT